MPSYSGVFTLQTQMQAIAAQNWPALPGAPTSVIATATGQTTATVAFTAPANPGVPPATSYTVTSSPGGITGTASASPISITGLTAGTTYTFTVTATSAMGTGPASAPSNIITTTPVIGQAYAGGFFAGQISTAGNSVADFNLVVCPAASGLSLSPVWSNFGTQNDPGTGSVVDGFSNSQAINNSNYPAAFFCRGRTTGGFTDWYLPAKNELEILYFNFKPTSATNNNTSSGINPNAVPARASNYTSTNPAQTTATSFQNSNSESFIANGVDVQRYFTSSQINTSSVWSARFNANGYNNAGYQQSSSKSGGQPVRAIRRVAV